MQTNSITLIALLFLLLANNTINITQLLLLLALLSTTGCMNNCFCANNFSSST